MYKIGAAKKVIYLHFFHSTFFMIPFSLYLLDGKDKRYPCCFAVAVQLQALVNLCIYLHIGAEHLPEFESLFRFHESFPDTFSYNPAFLSPPPIIEQTALLYKRNF